MPIIALEPFRIANQYGLFAVMTRGRYEIEFQGSSDGQTWIAYPFRYKPQALNEAPRIYAPISPGSTGINGLPRWVPGGSIPGTSTELKLLSNDKEVLKLFAEIDFREPPQQIRALLWQYWFTSMAEKRSTGMWWRRVAGAVRADD